MSGSNLFGIPRANRWTKFIMVPSATTTAPKKSPLPTGDSAFYRRVGDSMEIVWNYRHVSTDTPGVIGNGDYLYPIPDGYKVNQELIPCGLFNTNTSTSNGQPPVGIAAMTDESGNAFIGTVFLSRDGKNMMLSMPFNTVDVVPISHSSSHFPFDQANLAISIKAMIPIHGWDNV